jgi:hypothetical protein
MRHVVVEEHSDHCKIQTQQMLDRNDEYKIFARHCERNKEHFIFYHNRQYFILSHHACIMGGNRYDFYTDVIKSAIESSKEIEYYDIKRSWDIEKDLKESRLRGIDYKTHIHEINFTYSDNAGKGYAIATDIKFSEKLLSNINSEDELNETIQYLKDHKLEFLIDEAKRLHELNKVNISEKEVFKTIEKAIKLINKQVNSKNK